jgi:hypothetical protein
MKRLPLSSLLSLIVFHAVATCSVDAAPSTEVLFSTAPKAITGLYTSFDSRDPNRNGGYVPIPDYEYTPWRLTTITEVGGQAQISYELSLNPQPDARGNNFLFTEGFLVFSTSPYYKPTHLFVDSTRPDDIEGGLWTFGYRIEPNQMSFYSWTWTQDPPSTATPPAATNTGAKVRMSLDLNRAVARSLRGKESRKVLSLLKRQQNLLDEALAATQ